MQVLLPYVWVSHLLSAEGKILLPVKSTARGKKDYQWKWHHNSEAFRSWKLTELEKNACSWSLCCCWPLRPTSSPCHQLVPPVLPHLAWPQVRCWGEPFPCPSLGLALPGPDPKFANVQPVSDTPKHPKQKNCFSVSGLLPISKCSQDLWGDDWKKLLLITLKLSIPLSVQYFLHILLNFISVYNCNIIFVFCAQRERISKSHLRVFTKHKISQRNLHAERNTYLCYQERGSVQYNLLGFIWKFKIFSMLRD